MTETVAAEAQMSALLFAASCHLTMPSYLLYVRAVCMCERAWGDTPSPPRYLLSHSSFPVESGMAGVAPQATEESAQAHGRRLKKGSTANGHVQVSEGHELYSVTQMAELLFGRAAQSAQVYAAHKLLTGDRLLFKQAGRLPPLFQPRPSSEVQMLRARAAAEAEVQRLPVSLLLCVGKVVVQHDSVPDC